MDGSQDQYDHSTSYFAAALDGLSSGLFEDLDTLREDLDLIQQKANNRLKRLEEWMRREQPADPQDPLDLLWQLFGPSVEDGELRLIRHDDGEWVVLDSKKTFARGHNIAQLQHSYAEWSRHQSAVEVKYVN